MDNLWQSSQDFHGNRGGEYKFIGDHGTSFIVDIYVRLALEGREWNEIIFIIKAREMELYKFHSNPSELIGYDSGTEEKVQADEINYIHDMADDDEITTLLEETFFDSLNSSFERQFGYSFNMVPMKWNVEFPPGGQLIARGTF